MKKLLPLFIFLIGTAALAVPFVIKVGSSPNMEDGDFPNDAWTKQNSNNAYLETHNSGAFNSMSFQVASNAFTNVICGYLRFTNGDGRAFTIGVGTNLP